MEQTAPPIVKSNLRLFRVEQSRYQRRRLVNLLMTILLMVLTIACVAVLFFIVASIFINGIGALNLDFFTKSVADGGIANSILGTIEMAFVAALIAVPIGLLTAIYLSEYGEGWFASVVRWSLDLLAQMPSIVIGLFVLALFIYSGFTGHNGLTGAIALAIIMLPIVGRNTEEMLRLVPDSLREAALALGMPRWRVILKVVIPTVLPGLLTGVILSIARAAGETAPLLLTALGTSYFEGNLTQPMDAIPLRLYKLALYSSDELSHQQAWTAGLVLIGVIAIFSAFVRVLTRRLRYES
jgi:phosphate transport system permease protein